MKFCLIVLLLAAATAMDQAEMKAEMMKKLEACAKETHASADDIAVLKAYGIPDSHEGKCAIFCLHKLCKMQNEDGSVNIEAGLATLQSLKGTDEDEMHGKLIDVFKTCASQVATDSDPCITAANLKECALKEMKTAGINFP